MADDPSSPLRRHRPSAMATASESLDGSPRANPSPLSSSAQQQRNAPHLPTPAETAVLALYPALLVFGSVFSLVSPQVRGATYDAGAQALLRDQAPSYFARKDNIFNVLFVKQGWAWVTTAFAAFVLTHPHHTTTAGGEQQQQPQRHLIPSRRARALLRWALVTGWWFLVTQWFFGPPLIDRGFRYTGGKCEEVEQQVFGSGRAEGVANSSPAEILSAAACRTAGGRWRGGHDISGHVFLLVLGSFFLLQEAGWVAARAAGWAAGSGGRDPRAVVMHDGAVKGADVEGERVDKDKERSRLPGQRGLGDALGLGGKVVAGVVTLSMWMLLMTAIYFHTWFEKLTGLLVALFGLYGVYIVPRSVPALRRVVGLPGI